MPWTRDWGSPTPSSASSEHESDDGTGSKPPKPRVHIVNRDVELARDVDLSTRYDTAIVKLNPFTIAASRAKRAGSRAREGEGEGEGGKKHGPVPLVDDGEVKGKDTARNQKRGGPVPSVLEKDSQMTGGGGGRLGRGGWGGGARKSAWVNAQNERIPRSAPAKKPTKAVGDESKGKGNKGRGKGKEREEDNAEDEDTKTQGQAGGKSLLAELDEFVAVAPANGEGKGKGKAKGNTKAKNKAKNTANDPGAKKSGKKTASKSKTSKTSKAEEDKPVFRRIPAGAAPTADFPIVQSLERQKLLPTKIKAKANTTSAKPVSKARFPMSSSSGSSSDSCERPNVIDIDRLVMGLSDRPNPSKSGGGGGVCGVDSTDQYGRLQHEKKVGAVTTKAQEDDIESIASDDSIQFCPAKGRDEQEGKDIVMSKYFGTTSDTQTQNINPYPSSAFPSAFPSLRESGPATRSDLLMTPRQRSNEQNQFEHPSTITHIEYLDEGSAPGKDAYSSTSALPYSSPTDTRKLKREDSDGIVRPKPQRLVQIERMAQAAENSGPYAMEEFGGRTTKAIVSSAPHAVERGGLPQKRARSPPVGAWSDDTQPMGHTDHVKSKNPFHIQDHQVQPGHNPYADRNIKNPYDHPSFFSHEDWSTVPKSKKSRGNANANGNGAGGNTTYHRSGSGLPHKFDKPVRLFPTSTHSTSSITMAAPTAPTQQAQSQSQSQSLKTLTPDAPAPCKLTLFTPSAPAPAPQARVQKWTVQTAHGWQYGAPAPAARDKDINIPLRHPIADRLPVFRRAKTVDPAPQRQYWQHSAPVHMMDAGAAAGPEEWTRSRQMEMRQEIQAGGARGASNEFRFARAPSFVTSQPNSESEVLTVPTKGWSALTRRCSGSRTHCD